LLIAQTFYLILFNNKTDRKISKPSSTSYKHKTLRTMILSLIVIKNRKCLLITQTIAKFRMTITRSFKL